MAIDLRNYYTKVDLDVRTMTVSGRYWGKEGDSGKGFHVRLVEKGIVIIPTAEVLTFHCEKPDGNQVWIGGVVNGDGFDIELTNQVFAKNGEVHCEFRLITMGLSKSTETFIIKSHDGVRENAIESIPVLMEVDQLIEDIKMYEPLLPQWYVLEQARDDAEQLRIQAEIQREANAGIIEGYKDIAVVAQDVAVTKAAEAEASATNALLSENNAKTSELNAKNSEVNAESSELTATQVMQDLLAMIGSDIATLTDGKLSPSQIPSIAINDTTPVNSTAEMLALVAQKGDVALMMGLDEDEQPIVTDSYILAGNDATVLSNWKKLGVSFVSNAGVAQTALYAENTDTVNGHRVVVMTQAQYDIAVKDPETVYLVSGV